MVVSPVIWFHSVSEVSTGKQDLISYTETRYSVQLLAWVEYIRKSALYPSSNRGTPLNILPKSGYEAGFFGQWTPLLFGCHRNRRNSAPSTATCRF